MSLRSDLRKGKICYIDVANLLRKHGHRDITVGDLLQEEHRQNWADATFLTGGFSVVIVILVFGRELFALPPTTAAQGTLVQALCWITGATILMILGSLVLPPKDRMQALLRWIYTETDNMKKG